MLLIFLAVSLDILIKATSTAQVEEVIRVLRDSCFDIDLCKSRARNGEECRFIASKLIEHLQNDP